MRPELGQDSAPVAVVVEACHQVAGFRDPAEFSHRAIQRGWPTAALQNYQRSLNDYFVSTELICQDVH